MSTDAPAPEDVHPEHDVLTPENAEDWTDEQLEAYEEAKRAEHAAESEQNRREFTEQQQAALDRLSKPSENDRATVPINADGDEVTVRTSLSPSMEQTFVRVVQEDIDDVTGAVYDLIVHVIEDEEYADRAVWEAFYADNGTAALRDMFHLLLEPYIDRMQEVEGVGNSPDQTEVS